MATWSEWPDSNRHIWVGGPWSCRWTTLALVRPTGNDPVPPRWQRGMRPPHPGRTWTGSSPAPHVTSVVKEPTLTSDGFTHTSNRRPARDSNPIAPAGENGVTARQRTIRSYHSLATAPGFEPGPTSSGGSDAALHHAAARRSPRHRQISRHLRRLSGLVSLPKPTDEKKGLLGVRPRRPVPV
jgi:hypothetical protein